ncbi:hypothetical protein GCM10020219_026850 [Nonomuraea dietziae]
MPWDLGGAGIPEGSGGAGTAEERDAETGALWRVVSPGEVEFRRSGDAMGSGIAEGSGGAGNR